MAKYGVVETTKLSNSVCFDFQSNVDVENGMVVVKGDLVDGERLIYHATFPTAAQLATEKVYLVANPAWNYDESSIIKQNEEEYVNEAGRAYRGYSLNATNRFKVTEYTITPITEGQALEVGQYVQADADSGNLKASNTAPTGIAFVGKIIAIDETGFPFAIGSAGSLVDGDAANEFGHALDGRMRKVLIEVLRNDPV